MYDPNILMWQDYSLWAKEKKGVLSCSSIKICRTTSNGRVPINGSMGEYAYFNLSKRQHKLTDSPDQLYGRGSSGPLMYEFARSLGFTTIVLLGMDCKKLEGISDFYGDNPQHKKQTLPQCVAGLDFIKKNSVDVTIINCSKNDVFDISVSLTEALESLSSPTKKTRVEWNEKLV